MGVDERVKFAMPRDQTIRADRHIRFVYLIRSILFEESREYDDVVLRSNLPQTMDTLSAGDQLRQVEHLIFGQMPCERVTCYRAFVKSNCVCSIRGSLTGHRVNDAEIVNFVAAAIFKLCGGYSDIVHMLR